MHGKIISAASRFIGVPDEHTATRIIFQARNAALPSASLTEVCGFAEHAAPTLAALGKHPNAAIRKHARAAAMALGINAPVAVGFTLEGDSA